MSKTIIFDLGNVIVNVDKAEQYRKLAGKSNKNVFYVRDYIEKCKARKYFEEGKLTPQQFYFELKNDLNLSMKFKEFKNVWCNIFTLNKGVEKLVRKLEKNYKLILLSNTDILHFEYMKNKYKIIKKFDDYVLSYKVGFRKPSPLIFLAALKKAKSLPFDCIYIDDIPDFVRIASFMGIRAFQYSSYEKLVGDLNKAKIV